MWRNKKYGRREYYGHYDRHRGERIFVLSWVSKDGMKYHNLDFESWQMAVAVGWVKK